MSVRRVPRCLAVCACAAMLILAGCTAAETEPHTRVATQTSQPDASLTVIDGSEGAAAIHTSEELFDRAGVVLLAPAGDAQAQHVAAEAAVRIGVPLLVAPAEDEHDGSADNAGAELAKVRRELGRLKASTVVAVGDVANLPGERDDAPDKQSDPAFVRVRATASALGKAVGVQLTASRAGESSVPAAIAALDPGEGGPATPSRGAEGAKTVPRVSRDAPVTGTVALAVDASEQVAAIATARAAGVPVHVVPAASVNPQASPEVIAALHDASADKTLALGAPFAAEPALDWKIRSARSGTQLPGGGQVLFPRHQFVAIYGVPGSAVLGILGEQGSAAAVQRARDVAAPYQSMTDRTVVPMFEMMATVASGSAGADGNYSNELPIDELRPWVEEATAAGLYVVLDLQPGRTDFLTQAKQYQPLLELPGVGLALDPEWRLAPGQVHLRQIGSVSAAEINSVSQWLADLTNQKGLPQKLFVLHQFQLRMISDRPAVDTSRPELAVVIHADGQGAQPDKQATWNALREGAPAGVAWGWKNFYDEDQPMLTPEQTMRSVSPVPDLVSYQ